MSVWQKLGMILENKSGSKVKKLEKMFLTRNGLLNACTIIKKKKYIENRLWMYDLGNFWQTDIHWL